MPSYAFSKNRRLLKASEFQEVFDGNKVKVSHPKLLILAKLSDCEQSRLGLVIGKKNVPTAVARNRIKRAVRDTFRQIDFPLPLDIIFLARKDAGLLSSKELNLLLGQSWGRLLQRFDVLENNNA
ncbi:ribonuclease P protein component [Porticoccaceae bacterium]|nr:ribonuclease P protein component [Porticoccaceae bacterium]MDB9843024.1 ribonuclease P protein component [Porticoccaceae bacterium]MDC0133827.1 ribonuclease P protein component [Porticoccaceae bacterium]MDC1477055.1 ribonuclease P protein component [Porticoccaceae bacterium]